MPGCKDTGPTEEGTCRAGTARMRERGKGHRLACGAEVQGKGWVAFSGPWSASQEGGGVRKTSDFRQAENIKDRSLGEILEVKTDLGIDHMIIGAEAVGLS